MATRSATATQADIARAIRALVDAGFEHPRIVFTKDGVVIEPGPEPRHYIATQPEDDEPEIIHIV